MWIRNNMMHENNTMSQHKSRQIAQSLALVTRTDNGFVLSWILLITLIASSFGSLADAQPTMSIPQSLDAFRLVDGWVRDWEVPRVGEPGFAAAPVKVAIVTLRLDGWVLGRGFGFSNDPSPVVVLEAAKGALQSANAKLSTERDAMWDQYIEDLASRITITLEIADRLVPMSESELELPGFGYTPGVLGIAVRRGDRTEIMGPESMLSRNTDMTQSAMALANALAGDGSAVLRSPSELAQSGYRFYRFEPIVLAHPGESMGAAFIDRGGRVIEGSEIGMRSISELSSNIAQHLMSRQWPGIEPYGMMGALDPVTGTSASPFASPFEQAISAYALLRFGDLGTSNLHRDATAAGTEVLRDLAIVEGDEISAWDDPLSTSMALIALSEIQLIDILGDEPLNTLRTRCISELDGLYTPADGFDVSLPKTTHGLITHALVRVALLDPRDRTQRAQSALSRVFEETPMGGLVGQMPFLGWAAMELSLQGQEIESQELLVEMRDIIWEHQLTREDLAWMDRDLAGGIVFTSSSTPLPSWVSMRPLAVLATMLGDDRLTPGTVSSGEIPVQISRQVRAIRFIRQLCAAEETLHLYASPKNASWGVRMALWDQRMPVEADAMALLTLTETTRSFKEIMAKSSP